MTQFMGAASIKNQQVEQSLAVDFLCDPKKKKAQCLTNVLLTFYRISADIRFIDQTRSFLQSRWLAALPMRFLSLTVCWKSRSCHTPSASWSTDAGKIVGSMYRSRKGTWFLLWFIFYKNQFKPKMG